MRAGRPAIVSDPMPPQSVSTTPRRIGADLWLRRAATSATRATASSGAGSGARARFSGLAYPALRGANQLLNAVGRAGRVRGAARAPADQRAGGAQRPGDGRVAGPLPDRAGQPTLVLDVAHNPHAVAALAQNLDQMGFFPRTHAVFGAMRDKDIAAILARMAPLVDDWYFTDLPTARAASAASSPSACATVAGVPPGTTVATHASPPEALPRRWPPPTPLIESSSSARSTPWAACWRTDCRSGSRSPRRLKRVRIRRRRLVQRIRISARTRVHHVQAQERPRPAPSASPPMPCSRRARAPGSA